MIYMCFNGARGWVLVTFHTKLFLKTGKSHRSWCNTLTRVIASAAATSLVLGDSRTKVMMYTMFVQCLPLFLHTRIIPNYLN